MLHSEPSSRLIAIRRGSAAPDACSCAPLALRGATTRARRLDQRHKTIPEAATMNALTPVPPMSLSQHVPPSSSLVNDGEVERLYAALNRVSWSSNPRTARLLSASLRKMSQKVVEEAAEVALEAVRKRTDAAVRESADLIYHLIVLWHKCGIEPEQIWAEMRQRADAAGIAEKLPKSPPDRRGAPDPITSIAS
ncbi:MAG: phosphoribosyl-ATP diphosphatase [Vulcanimicrobiaceae bacterium]